jgi:PAS domain S-box-containing protein
MNIFTFLVLIISIGLFLIANHLYKEYQKNTFHRIYIRLFFTCGIFVFVLFLISNASSRSEARFYLRFLAVSHFIFPFITDSLLHLFRDKFKFNNRIKNAILYTPFIIFFIIDLVYPSLTFEDPKLTPYGWMYVNKTGLSIFTAYHAVYAINILVISYLIIYFFIREADNHKRRFLLFYSLLFLFPFGIFLMLNFIYNWGTTYIVPYVAISGIIFFSIIFLFLKRYSIFDISLEIASKDIAKNMPNMLFLLDKEYRIAEVNNYVCQILSYQPNDLIQLSFMDIIHSGRDEYDSFRFPKIDSEVFFKSKDKRYIPALITVSKIHRRKHFLGYMVIGNDLSGIHRLSGEKKILQLELKALQSQMNPHFIFNALNSIMVLISKRDELKANEYISCLSNLIRRVMENVNKELVTIDEEIELLRSYIAIESLRFDEGFSYNIEKKGISHSDLPILPPMIIQPFVENAIWHGLLPMKDNVEKKLSIRFVKYRNQLEVCISDNGVGRIKAQQIKSSKHKIYNSQGIRNIEERIRLYNSFSEHLYIDLHIDDLTDVNQRAIGTEVRIYFDILKPKLNDSNPDS